MATPTQAPPVPTSSTSTATTSSKEAQNAGASLVEDTRPVFFFDIDNCLYPRSYKIHDLMKVLIHKYFVNHLELTEEGAKNLHLHYYTQYGLALSGLVRHHTIDVMEYNRLVDDSLPLETIIQPSQSLIRLLTSLTKSQTCAKLWLFTNAYINHARRVVKLLGIEEFFDGVTYCDYEGAAVKNEGRLVCKPQKEMFDKAMLDAGLTPGKDEKRCYFVDDSRANCVAAKKFGWGRVAHLVEPELGENVELRSVEEREGKDGIVVIRDLGELREVFPELFTVEGEEGVKERVGHEPLREESPGRELPRRLATPLPEEK